MSVQTDFYEMPAGSYEPGLRLIHGDANNGVTTKIKKSASNVWGWITGHIAAGWNWIKTTLHLQPAIDWVKSSYITAWGVARKVGSSLGVGGGAGAGMLMVATSGGRKVLHYVVGVPLGFIGKWLGKGWHKVEDFHTDHLGSYGNWVAEKMQDTEEWMFGENRVTGVVGKITGFYMRHIAKHLHLNSIAMRTVRLVGTILFGVGALNVLPLFLVDGALTVAVYVVGGATIGMAGWQSFHLGKTIGAIPAVVKWINESREASSKAARAATSTVNGVNIATLVEDMNAATANTAAKPKNPNVRPVKNAPVK